MPRARYANNAVTHDGRPVNIVPNATITLYEAGTTTPLADTIFAAATGVGTLPNPFVTDEHGNIEFFLDAAKRVKVVASGVGVGTMTADHEPVHGDPATLTLNPGLTITMSSASSPALSIQNTNAAGDHLVVKNSVGTTVGTWDADGLTRGPGDVEAERVGFVDHSLAPSGNTWAGLHYSVAQTSVVIGSRSNPGTGYGSVLLAPYISAGARGAGVGIPTIATLGGMMLGVAGAIGVRKISTPSNPTADYSGLYPGIDERWRRISSAGAVKILAEEGGTAVILPTTPSSQPFGDLTGAGLAVAAATETDLTTNQSFTVQNAASVIEIIWSGYIQYTVTVTPEGVTARMRIDSAGANTLHRIGGERVNVAGHFANPLSGCNGIYISGLSVGAHTVKLTLFCEQAGTVHMRNNGTEFLRLQVIEHK